MYATPPSVAVVAHVFYPDVWAHIAKHLRKFPGDFELYASVPDGEQAAALRQLVLTDFPLAQIVACENRGRDIAPFMQIMERFDLYTRDAVLKIHTKKSPHLGAEGALWMDWILQSCLGDEATILSILEKFAALAQIGMIYPNFAKTPIQTNLIHNVRWLDELCRRLEARGSFDWDFPAGSMFWFRGAALVPLRDLGIRSEHFEAEAGQTDGTLAHALERIFPLLVYKSRHAIVSINDPKALTVSYLQNEFQKQLGGAPAPRKGFRQPKSRGRHR